jgi:prolyl-tRNA synthetase
MLGQNFSKSFGITFKDESGKDIHAWQTCYGPAIWRMMSSIVALHGDDKGLKFPFKIAPMQIVIIPIKGAEKEAYKMQRQLMDAGLRVAVDASDATPGWKFNQWEMKGVPIRIELGPKELKEGAVTLARRDTGEKMKVKESELAKRIPEIGAAITKNMVKAADDWFFRGNINDAKDMKSLEAQLKKGGFVRVPFCTDGAGGEMCAGKVRDETHADVRGVRADKEEKPASGSKCIACGQKAGAVVYAARQY